MESISKGEVIVFKNGIAEDYREYTAIDAYHIKERLKSVNQLIEINNYNKQPFNGFIDPKEKCIIKVEPEWYRRRVGKEFV